LFREKRAAYFARFHTSSAFPPPDAQRIRAGF